jgi:hypothetical protein
MNRNLNVRTKGHALKNTQGVRSGPAALSAMRVFASPRRTIQMEAFGKTTALHDVVEITRSY